MQAIAFLKNQWPINRLQRIKGVILTQNIFRIFIMSSYYYHSYCYSYLLLIFSLLLNQTRALLNELTLTQTGLKLNNTKHCTVTDLELLCKKSIPHKMFLSEVKVPQMCTFHLADMILSLTAHQLCNSFGEVYL